MVLYQIGYKPGTVFVNCLLKGTLVKVSEDVWIPIEDLKVGDTVLTHEGLASKVTEISKDVIVWEDEQKIENKIVFKIPAGRLGATVDTFLSFWHRILHQDGEFTGEWRTAAASRIPKAKKDEICKSEQTTYELYNLHLENQTDTFVVNGGVVVESWSGKAARVKPVFSSA
jgi:hypothetical protein